MPIEYCKTFIFSSLLCAAANAQETPHFAPPPSPPESLKSVNVPSSPGLELLIRDRQWAIVLGKALFWDQQAGSDGNACATCHYHAGVDNRMMNQVSPSLLSTKPGMAGKYDAMCVGSGGPNYRLKSDDFPTHQLADPNDRESEIVFTTDDVVSSMGVFRSDFIRNSFRHVMFDDIKPIPDPVFRKWDRNCRRVEPRNTPTTINAAFGFDLFWDGRAKNTFNGQNPHGRRDEDARILSWNGRSLTPKRLRLRNAALASQAVGPTLSEMEMSGANRSFIDVAKKLLPRQALQFQNVLTDDSVLGDYVDEMSGLGLDFTYEELVKLAFSESLWGAPPTRTSSAGNLQIEHNFAMFWGLSIMAYEQTLISTETRFEEFTSGTDPNALTAQEQRGLDIFIGQGNCILCHKGPDFSGGGFVLQGEASEGGLVERMHMGDGRTALYDNGFYNIGVTPTEQDIGRGANGPFGTPLAWSGQWLNQLNHGEALVDRFEVVPSTFEAPATLPFFATPGELTAAFGKDAEANDGAFKTPGLFNIELTGPYMHNGSMSTLEQVVDFYNRGGNVRSVSTGGDTSGFDGSPSNLAPDISPLGLTSGQKADLVACLKSLTDERVRMEEAPFDHPSLVIPEGHINEEHSQLGQVDNNEGGRVLPAVGRGGRAGIHDPLQPFHMQLEPSTPRLSRPRSKPTPPRSKPTPPRSKPDDRRQDRKRRK